MAGASGPLPSAYGRRLAAEPKAPRPGPLVATSHCAGSIERDYGTPRLKRLLLAPTPKDVPKLVLPAGGLRWHGWIEHNPVNDLEQGDGPSVEVRAVAIPTHAEIGKLLDKAKAEGLAGVCRAWLVRIAEGRDPGADLGRLRRNVRRRHRMRRTGAAPRGRVCIGKSLASARRSAPALAGVPTQPQPPRKADKRREPHAVSAWEADALPTELRPRRRGF